MGPQGTNIYFPHNFTKTWFLKTSSCFWNSLARSLQRSSKSYSLCQSELGLILYLRIVPYHKVNYNHNPNHYKSETHSIKVLIRVEVRRALQHWYGAYLKETTNNFCQNSLNTRIIFILLPNDLKNGFKGWVSTT